MKPKKIILLIILSLSLTACNKEVENYEPKEKKVDSVFDNIKVTSKDERETNTETVDKSSNVHTQDADATRETDESDQEQSSETKDLVMRTNTDVNFRTEPSLDADIITVIPEDSEVIIVEEDAGFGWTKIKYEDRQGYVDRSLLR